MSGDAGGEMARADLWDAVVDERQRLADERDQLADEREELANQRERLADEQEGQVDQRYGALAEQAVLGEVLDEEIVRVEAESRVARAQARLERATAERDRAQLALEREDLSRTRHETDRERVARRAHDFDDDGWDVERRDFVAAERDRLADLRELEQTGRDDVAHRRERDADDRDQRQHQRERHLESLDSRPLSHAETSRELRRARNDLAEVRQEAIRQRRITARVRQRAAADRARSRHDANPVTLAPTAYGPLLAAEFVTLTRELFASRRLDHIVETVLGFALECLPTYVAAGSTISGTGLPALHVATDPVAQQLDALQTETEQGPSLEAFQSPDPVHAVTFDQWPAFASTAAQLGITTVLAYGLSVPRDATWHPLGVLTFYAETPVELDDDSRDLGSILASYLAVAAGLQRDRHDLTRREAALHRALSTRDVIGQAKGILMERQRMPAGDAFDILRRTSQRLNLRLHEVAARLTETGEIPT
jgi:hypothetical protein